MYQFLVKKKKNLDSGAGEMAQWVRALSALPEELNSIPSTQVRQLTTPYNSGSRASCIFWLPQVCTQVVCTRAHTHMTEGFMHTHMTEGLIPAFHLGLVFCLSETRRTAWVR